ncbi:acyltransferase [Mucilaginibacter glaciei]|uniref:Acyltransferase n=1 Tax=Mucilaginibacter glaciei TaxID=2772109 RepID=A0A926NVN0_9SPHI|nr:acyltransferase [Mucilaginibacter glaciei]MBD1395407.1 acyltransferase [Mucilaginibacter glaciei]
MSKILKFLSRLTFKTIYFNFKYFPFKTAVKLPVLIGRNVFLHKIKGRVIITGPVKTAMVQIGYGQVGISDFKRSRAVWEVSGDVIFNGRAFIMHGCKLIVSKGAQLNIGENFNMSTECALVTEQKIVIGKNTSMSWESLVMDTDFHHIFDEGGNKINYPADIFIGDNVWIGCKCTVLKGAVIPNGCIVAASSLVTKKLTGEKNIFGGNPIKILKSNITWKL